MIKIKLKSLVLSILCLSSIVPIMGQDYYFYTNTGGTITIARYIGPPGDVTVPPTINDLPVTEIGSQAFYNQSGLTGVTLPDCVTKITSQAFENSSNMRYIEMGQGVTEIGNSAFDGCSSLSNVVIPYSVLTVGDQAFQSCSGMTNVLIGRSVTSLGNATFVLCTKLTSVVIPDSVTAIGTTTFFQCFTLTNVVWGNGIVSIGNGAFFSCNLKTIYARGNAPSLGTSVFSSGEHPKVYYLPDATGWSTFATTTGFTTMQWNPRMQNVGRIYGESGELFGFNIIASDDLILVIEGSADLPSMNWTPLQTITLSGGSAVFIDSNTGSYDLKFYRFHNFFAIAPQYIPPTEEEQVQVMQSEFSRAWAVSKQESETVTPPLPPPPPLPPRWIWGQ